MEPEIRSFNDNIFKRYTDAYLSSNFARSEFSRVLRNFLPGFSTVEKILTLQPLAEGELLSSVVPVRYIKAAEVPVSQRMRDAIPSKKVNLDAYRQELRDNNIFYRETPEPVKDIVQKTDNELLSKWGKDYVKDNPKSIWTSKKALDKEINWKYDLYRDQRNDPGRKIIWDNYVGSMDRRRHDYFYHGIQEGNYPPMMVVDNSSVRPSAIFGFGDTVFYPSHFAPGSMRSGYRMLEDLNNAERSVMFAVPEDLSKQLSKMGYTKIGSQPQPFNGGYVMKDLMVNRNASVEDFAEQMGKSVQEILDNFNGKITELNGKHYFSTNPSIKDNLILK